MTVFFLLNSWALNSPCFCNLTNACSCSFCFVHGSGLCIFIDIFEILLISQKSEPRAKQRHWIDAKPCIIAEVLGGSCTRSLCSYVENVEILYYMALQHVPWQLWFSSRWLCGVINLIAYSTGIYNKALKCNMFPVKYFVTEIVLLKIYSGYLQSCGTHL